MALIEMRIKRSPTKTVAILHHAWRALEYQWSAENMGSGIQKWTPDTAQYMANVIDDIASLLGEFEEHRGKEVKVEQEIYSKEIKEKYRKDLKYEEQSRREHT
jgi:hypothetical protein